MNFKAIISCILVLLLLLQISNSIRIRNLENQQEISQNEGNQPGSYLKQAQYFQVTHDGELQEAFNICSDNFSYISAQEYCIHHFNTSFFKYQIDASCQSNSLKFSQYICEEKQTEKGIFVQNCQFSTDQSQKCKSQKCVNIQCIDENNKIKNGETYLDNNLLVFNENKWGQICDLGFGEIQSHAICVQNGYQRAVKLHRHQQCMSGFFWINQLSCDKVQGCYNSDEQWGILNSKCTKKKSCVKLECKPKDQNSGGGQSSNDQQNDGENKNTEKGQKDHNGQNDGENKDQQGDGEQIIDTNKDGEQKTENNNKDGESTSENNNKDGEQTNENNNNKDGELKNENNNKDGEQNNDNNTDGEQEKDKNDGENKTDPQSFEFQGYPFWDQISKKIKGIVNGDLVDLCFDSYQNFTNKQFMDFCNLTTKKNFSHISYLKRENFVSSSLDNYYQLTYIQNENTLLDEIKISKCKEGQSVVYSIVCSEDPYTEDTYSINSQNELIYFYNYSTRYMCYNGNEELFQEIEKQKKEDKHSHKNYKGKISTEIVAEQLNIDMTVFEQTDCKNTSNEILNSNGCKDNKCISLIKGYIDFEKTKETWKNGNEAYIIMKYSSKSENFNLKNELKTKFTICSLSSGNHVTAEQYCKGIGFKTFKSYSYIECQPKDAPFVDNFNYKQDNNDSNKIFNYKQVQQCNSQKCLQIYCSDDIQETQLYVNQVDNNVVLVYEKEGWTYDCQQISKHNQQILCQEIGYDTYNYYSQQNQCPYHPQQCKHGQCYTLTCQNIEIENVKLQDNYVIVHSKVEQVPLCGTGKQDDIINLGDQICKNDLKFAGIESINLTKQCPINKNKNLLYPTIESCPENIQHLNECKFLWDQRCEQNHCLELKCSQEENLSESGIMIKNFRANTMIYSGILKQWKNLCYYNIHDSDKDLCQEHGLEMKSHMKIPCDKSMFSGFLYLNQKCTESDCVLLTCQEPIKQDNKGNDDTKKDGEQQNPANNDNKGDGEQSQSDKNKTKEDNDKISHDGPNSGVEKEKKDEHKNKEQLSSFEQNLQNIAQKFGIKDQKMTTLYIMFASAILLIFVVFIIILKFCCKYCRGNKKGKKHKKFEDELQNKFEQKKREQQKYEQKDSETSDIEDRPNSARRKPRRVDRSKKDSARKRNSQRSSQEVELPQLQLESNTLGDESHENVNIEKLQFETNFSNDKSEEDFDGDRTQNHFSSSEKSRKMSSQNTSNSQELSQ